MGRDGDPVSDRLYISNGESTVPLAHGGAIPDGFHLVDEAVYREATDYSRVAQPEGFSSLRLEAAKKLFGSKFDQDAFRLLFG